jgi:hypothetical protein
LEPPYSPYFAMQLLTLRFRERGIERQWTQKQQRRLEARFGDFGWNTKKWLYCSVRGVDWKIERGNRNQRRICHKVISKDLIFISNWPIKSHVEDFSAALDITRGACSMPLSACSIGRKDIFARTCVLVSWFRLGEDRCSDALRQTIQGNVPDIGDIWLHRFILGWSEEDQESAKFSECSRGSVGEWPGHLLATIQLCFKLWKEEQIRAADKMNVGSFAILSRGRR